MYIVIVFKLVVNQLMLILAANAPADPAMSVPQPLIVPETAQACGTGKMLYPV